MNTSRQRDTKQRHAIRDALVLAGRPLSPKEILAYAGRDVPRLGIATVYRNIKAMLERKEIEEVEIPGQISRYRIPQETDPHLFIDERRDEVHVIEPDLSLLRLSLPRRYRARRIQLICYGEVADEPRSRRSGSGTGLRRQRSGQPVG